MALAATTIIAGSCFRRPSRLPAAIILLVGGLISCFAGYRVFRVVLGIYGFILGALLASGVAGPENTVWMIAAALVGGVVGALILIAAYFVGVALLGAGIGALATSLIWASLGREPSALDRDRLRDRRRARRARAPALRHRRRHRVRRRLDDHRRRARAHREPRSPSTPRRATTSGSPIR